MTDLVKLQLSVRYIVGYPSKLHKLKLHRFISYDLMSCQALLLTRGNPETLLQHF